MKMGEGGEKGKDKNKGERKLEEKGKRDER